MSKEDSGLGRFLREQRTAASMSLRQLADITGISNPYLSQIERGLKKPSAEILQALAQGLHLSAEQVYIQAGILDPRVTAERVGDVRQAIRDDPALNSRQRDTLLEIYESFIQGNKTHSEPISQVPTAEDSPEPSAP